MSMKSNSVNDSKRRTTTMNDLGDTSNGSTLELIAYQSDIRHGFENVNAGYCEGGSVLVCVSICLSICVCVCACFCVIIIIIIIIIIVIIVIIVIIIIIIIIIISFIQMNEYNVK